MAASDLSWDHQWTTRDAEGNGPLAAPGLIGLGEDPGGGGERSMAAT